MAWVTAEDVVLWWTGSEPPLLPNPTIDKLILGSEAVIKKTIPGIQAAITSGEIDSILVESVVAAMVQRAFQKTQDGKVSFNESSGPFSQGGSYGSTSALAFLTLTPDEVALLTPDEKIQRIQPVRIYASIENSRSGFLGGCYDTW